MTDRDGSRVDRAAPTAPGEVVRLSLELLAASPVVFYAMEVRGEVGRGLWASDGLSRMLGWSTDEAVQPGWWHRNVHAGDLERVASFYRERRHEDRLVCTYRFRHRDGSFRCIRDERLQQRGA
ncbi:MAG TPA: PAS domain-containing protein, partial [Thermoanaerobaculia bacterium]|nr:PAS domain-containing protein [Thermoanaerobaculia bacterium]